MMSCYDYPHYRLTFGNTFVGTSIIEWRPSFRHASDISVRHNYWASSVVLDGRYPALVWTHVIKIFDEQISASHYAKAFFDNLRSFIGSDPRTLTIVTSAMSPCVHLGPCYLHLQEQSEPEGIFLLSGGAYTTEWFGTTIPSIVIF